jgi:hypothetical protein
MIGFGQGWERTYDGGLNDYGIFVQQTTDGGYIICGSTESFGSGNSDVWLIKTDGIGDTLWTKAFGGNNDENGGDVQQTSDGGYIICGSKVNSFSSVNYDVWLIKTDGIGDTLWTNSILMGYGIFSSSVRQTIDGGYVICGTVDFGSPDHRGFLIKADVNGDQQWIQFFGGFSMDGLFDVKQTTDSGFIVCGYTYSYGWNGNEDVWLIKTDNNGDTLWTKTRLIEDGMGSSVQQTTDGGYIISGWTNKNFDTGNGSDVLLIKTDGIGDTLWTITFDNSFIDRSYSVQQTSDGGYIITGFTGPAGSFGSGDNDVYLIKTDANGNITSAFNIPTPNANRKLEKTVDILGRDIKPQTNTPLFYIYDDGTVEKRIVIE